MLRWQLKNVRNRHLLWLKLLACSFTIHIFFVGMLFFGYRDGSVTHTFTMHNHSINTHIAVVLVPTMQKANTSTASAKQTIIAKRTDGNVKTTNQTKAATQIAQPKPIPTKKVAPKKTAPAKPSPIKAAPVKTVQKKATPTKPTSVKKTTLVKTEPKKIVPAKVEPIKAKPVKIEPAKETPVKIEPTLANLSSEVVAKKETIAVKQPEVIANALQNAPSLAHELCVHDGSSTIEIPYGQAREFYQQEALRKELSRHWTPPHGIPDTCTCEITTYVGNNGVVTDSVITQPSGILMYDVSARAAILAMELPRWTWGSSFTITFKP